MLLSNSRYSISDNILFFQEPELTRSRASSALLGPKGEAQPHSKEKFGGYDCKFVTPPPTAFQTECPICHMILREPYQTACCGQNVCRSCRGKFEPLPNKGLRQSLIQLHVWCTFRENGCEWSGELGELEHHLKEADHSREYSQVSSMMVCF